MDVREPRAAPDAAQHAAADRRLQVLKAVADPTRLAVLDRLASCGDRCHCDLEAELGASTSRLSFHLKVLRDAELITPARQGRRVRYQLAPGALDELRAALPAPGPCEPPVVTACDVIDA